MVPSNDTGRVYSLFENDITKAMQKVAKSGFWLMGEETKAFEKTFANYCGSTYCITLANGTDALEIGLKTLLSDDKNKNNESEVITVANAGGYSSTACYLVGVIPVYADIHAKTQLIDIESITQCLSNKTRVIILTHLYGGIVDVLKVKTLLNKLNYGHVRILEDCAQAHGGRVGNKRVGSLGDLAAFSFYPTKNLGAMGDAGAIVTSNQEFYNIASKLKQYGWSKKYEIAVRSARNSRMDELQAAVLNVLLPSLDDFNNRRKQIYKRYLEAADGINLKFLDYSECDFVGHLVIAKVNKRNAFINFMRNAGVSVDIHYPILDIDQPAWKENIFRIDEMSGLKISRLQVNNIVSLPLFPLMHEHEICLVIDSIKKWGIHNE